MKPEDQAAFEAAWKSQHKEFNFQGWESIISGIWAYASEEEQAGWELWQAACEYKDKQAACTHRDAQPAGAQGEPVHFRAVLCSEQHDKALGVVPKIVGFVDKKAAEQFILEQRDFKGWKYNLESLYTEAPAAAINEQLHNQLEIAAKVIDLAVPKGQQITAPMWAAIAKAEKAKRGV